MKATRKELCTDVIQKLFFASEYQDINDDDSIRIVIEGTQIYNGSMYKHESVQGILKFNKIKVDWWQWEMVVDWKYIVDSYVDDGSLIINLSQEVLKDGLINIHDMANVGLRHNFFKSQSAYDIAFGNI
jgi:hypothetical protein